MNPDGHDLVRKALSQETTENLRMQVDNPNFKVKWIELIKEELTNRSTK